MELFERFKQGDMDAFEALFRLHQRDVYGWIVQIVRDPGLAEDLTIETFWRVYKARGRFDASYPFGAWVRRIATNLAIDHVRVWRREEELVEEPAAEIPDAADGREAREKIRQAFERLSPRLQSTANLVLIEEQSYEEIARASGKPVGTIRTRVFRAVRQLRKELRRLGMKP
ncbi:MAG TPA: sigma-70 family RNA polymerase sigma factor [Candidatus Acidoferrales bacterium]|nr:sigma-70 family RNA polymerase sigma factor [Candidatus Acidoferrales bacterium]